MRFELGTIPAMPPYQIKPGGWRDGIVIRSPNWLGDACMAAPAIVQLRRLVPPECGVFVICPENLAAFHERMDAVDLVVPLAAAHRNWSRRDIVRVNHLRPGVAMLFNNSPRDPLLLRLAGVPKIFGAAARCRGILMTRAFKFPARADRQLNRLHHTAKYLAMSMAVGAPAWDGALPAFRLDPLPESTDPAALAALGLDRLLVIAPGAAYGPAKRWPPEYFNQVCRSWLDAGGGVAAVGAPGEAESAATALRGLPPGRAVNLAGKTSLASLMAVLARAHACLANDSGVMHLAAILGAPGAAIFGSTDPTATAPVSKRWEILFDQQPCSPCFKRQCPRITYQCLHAISPETAARAVNQAAGSPSTPVHAHDQPAN
jgi:heptosyltransferase-2